MPWENEKKNVKKYYTYVVCVCMCVWHSSQRETSESLFFSSIMWVPQVEFRSLGMVARVPSY